MPETPLGVTRFRDWNGVIKTFASTNTLLAVLEDDWTNPEVWRKANPAFGITISAEQFAEDCRDAQESPAKEDRP